MFGKVTVSVFLALWLAEGWSASLVSHLFDHDLQAENVESSWFYNLKDVSPAPEDMRHDSTSASPAGSGSLLDVASCIPSGGPTFVAEAPPLYKFHKILLI